MIIKDLLDFWPTNTDKIVQELQLLYDVNEDKQERIRYKYDAFINTLKEKTPLKTDYIVLGIPCLDDGKESLNTSAFSKSDIQDLCTAPPTIKDENIDKLSLEEVNRVLSQLKLPDSYAYNLSPQDEVLGYEISPANLSDIGAAKLIAAILYEMTFWGFDEEEIKAFRQELDAAIAEAEQVENMSQGEREAYCASSMEFLQSLGLSECSSENLMREEHLAFAKEQLKSRLHTLTAIWKYKTFS